MRSAKNIFRRSRTEKLTLVHHPRSSTLSLLFLFGISPMKLTIERLTDLSHQDLIDLAKIWPNQQASDWQGWIDAGQPLFAARFNERLLGAVKVRVQDEQAELQDLQVRAVTRRRGVGLYLIEEMLHQLPAIQHWQLSYSEVLVLDTLKWINLCVPVVLVLAHKVGSVRGASQLPDCGNITSRYAQIFLRFG